MTVEITSKNISKFTKRLHKALKQTLGEHSPSLLQSAELLAQAAGFKTLHDLHSHLNVAEKVHIPSALQDTSFEEQWVHSIEGLIHQYVNTHSDSNIVQWSWSNMEGECALNLLSKDYGEGLYFSDANKEQNISSLTHHLNPTQDDIEFIATLISLFPKTKKENVLLDLYLKEVKNIQNNEWFLIAQPVHFSREFSESNLGWVTEDFIVVDKKSVDNLPFLSNNTQLIDISHVKELYSFNDFQKAVQCVLDTPNTVLLQRLSTTNKKASSFLGSPFHNFSAVQLQSVSNAAVQMVGSHNVLLYCFKGLLAQSRKLSLEHNPYAINQVEYGHWKDGFQHGISQLQQPNKTFKLNSI